MLAGKTKAQSVGAAYYKRKLEEKQAAENPKWIDVYGSSPLYAGIVNHIKIEGINLDELTKDATSHFTETAVKGEYEATFNAPGPYDLLFRNKLTNKPAYHYHYFVIRLPQDTLKVEPVITLADITGIKIGVSQLMAQRTIKITNGFKLISGQLYFSGSAFPNVVIISIPGFDVQRDSLFKSCKPGTQINFDNIKVADSTGKEYYISDETFTIITDNDASELAANSITELRRLINLNFVRGAIYFSGTYFSSVAGIYGSEINKAKYNLSARCASGSIISFENCVYKNENDVLVRLPDRLIKLP